MTTPEAKGHTSGTAEGPGTRRPSVIVDMSLHPGAMTRLREVAEVERWAADPDRRARQLARCSAIVTYVPRFDEAQLKSAERLRIIACHVCPEELRERAGERGVVVRTSRSLWDTVADHTVSLLLAVARSVPQAHAAVRARRWGREDLKVVFSGRDVFGKTLGIVGFGRIGQRVARRMAGFDMRIRYTDLQRRRAAEESLGASFRDLRDLLGESDFVVVLVPLDESTRGMIGTAELGAMKSSAIMVNASRGAVIDEMALYCALRDGVIAGAGLDVVASEPIAASHPLLELDNVVITPHLGGSTLDCDMDLVEEVVDTLTTT
jgi:phosphoglycerate dehydrogenase-like enzyme